MKKIFGRICFFVLLLVSSVTWASKKDSSSPRSPRTPNKLKSTRKKPIPVREPASLPSPTSTEHQPEPVISIKPSPKLPRFGVGITLLPVFGMWPLREELSFRDRLWMWQLGGQIDGFFHVHSGVALELSVGATSTQGGAYKSAVDQSVTTLYLTNFLVSFGVRIYPLRFSDAAKQEVPKATPFIVIAPHFVTQFFHGDLPPSLETTTFFVGGQIGIGAEFAPKPCLKISLDARFMLDGAVNEIPMDLAVVFSSFRLGAKVGLGFAYMF